MTKRLLALAVLCLCLGSVAQDTSYFNRGFLRQGDAHLDRVYLGLIDNPINTNTPAGMTNVILAIAGGGGGGGAQVWTNDGTFVSLSQQGVVDTTGTFPSPSVIIRTNDGSIFVGHNVAQDTPLTDANAWKNYHVSMTDSNEPPNGVTTDVGIDSENYNFYGYWSFTRTADKDQSRCVLLMDTALTNGNTGTFRAVLDPGGNVPGTAKGTSLHLYTNAVEIFTVNSNGVVTAKSGFASFNHNTLAPTTIIVGGSPFTFNNTKAVNIQVFLDANGGTDSVTFNGGTIFTSLAGADHTIIMQPGDAIVVTYSIATPVMKYREF